MPSLNGEEIKGPLGYVIATVAMLVVVIAILLVMAFMVAIAIGFVFAAAYFLIFFAVILIIVPVAAAMFLGWPIYLLSEWTPFFVYVPVFIAWLLLLGFLLVKLYKVLAKYKRGIR